MSSASKRVRRFLKYNTTVCINNSVRGGHPLWTTDLQELLEEKAYWKDRAERAEAKIADLKSEPIKVHASTEEMLRKRLLQYGDFEKAIRQALRLTPTYRNQNPPPPQPEFKLNTEEIERITAARLVNLSPSAGDIEFAPEN